jgi:hypothetical protein
MSAITSVSVNPNDAEGYVNKINIIDAAGPNGEKLDAPCYYVPFGVRLPTFGVNDFITEDLKVGKNYPDRYLVGKKYIDVVLTGDDVFTQKIPNIASIPELKIKPKTYAYYTLFTAGVLYHYKWRVREDDLKNLPEPGTFWPAGTDGRKNFIGVVYEENNINNVDYIGKLKTNRFDYLVFNSEDSVSIPSVAQIANVSSGSVVDFNGNTLLVELDMPERKVSCYSSNNGLKTLTKGFGFIKLEYAYQDHRFLLNYDCPDFFIEMSEMDDAGNYYYSDNKDNLAPGFFRVFTLDGVAPVNHVYKLDKKAEIVEFNAPSASDFSSMLEEQSRIEEERTYEDENGVSSIKMNIVKNVTLKGQDGKEWQLKFKNN